LDEESLVRDCRSLSVGEQQRVALARTLLNNPTVLLLDEPTANLDPPLARKIVSLVHRLHKELNLTTILVSHNHLLIREYADTVAFLINGELVETGPIENLVHPQTDSVRRFLEQEPA
jgi:putative ABC transport system ATP-binding protein